MPAELWYSPSSKLTFLRLRSSIIGGMRSFCAELIAFIKQTGFANVAVLTSTTSPIKRGRETNRQIPEIFAYLNNHMYKSNPDFYKQNGIQKFGNWIQDVKRRPHQELSELCGDGWAGRLMKAFNREEIPVIMFSVFCTGGVDFVGGYTYSEFLKKSLFGDAVSQATQQLGKLELSDKL